MTHPIPLTEPQLRAELARAVDAAGGPTAWSRKHGFTPQYVGMVVSGARDVSEAVANALGYFRQVRYVSRNAAEREHGAVHAR